MNESYTTKPESYDDKLEKDFINFIQEQDFTADDIQGAYIILLGISESEITDEKQLRLQTKMNEMISDKFPLNRFPQLIGLLDDIEGSAEDFEKFVTDLEISEREKDVLISIVRDRRTGELEFNVEGKSYIKVDITKNYSPDYIAFNLLQKLPEKLKVASNKGELSIQFSEE